MTDSQLESWYRELGALAADPLTCGADPEARWQVRALNPYCGDDITLYIRGDEDRCESIRYDGAACQVCRASSSLLARLARGERWGRVTDLQRQLQASFEHGADQPLPEPLALFEAVRRFPVRRQCAVLPWDALTRHLEKIAGEHDVE